MNAEDARRITAESARELTESAYLAIFQTRVQPQVERAARDGHLSVTVDLEGLSAHALARAADAAGFQVLDCGKQIQIRWFPRGHKSFKETSGHMLGGQDTERTYWRFASADGRVIPAVPLETDYGQPGFIPGTPYEYGQD